MAKHPQLRYLILAGLAGLSLTMAGQAQAFRVEQAQAPGASGVNPGRSFHSETGRYSVLMPLGAQAATTTTTVGSQSLTWTVSIARQGNSIYGVAYTDLPLELLAQGGEAVIESLRSSPFFEEFNWETLASRAQPVALGEISGLEFIHLEAGKASAARFYLANRRLYAVVAAAPDLHGVSQFVETFAIDDLWRPFVSEEGRFSVDLPMAPVFTPQQVSYQDKTLNWWQYVGYNLHSPVDRYGFAYADLPNALVVRNPDILLQEVATLVLTELNAPNLATAGTTISLGGMPGREYALTKPNGQSYVLRLYLGDRRLYGLLATSNSLNNLDRFLSSFQVQ